MKQGLFPDVIPRGRLQRRQNATLTALRPRQRGITRGTSTPFSGAGTEQRLSYLCHWVLEFDSSGEEYGLRLPNVVLQPAVGEKHRERVLKELALFGIGDPR